MSDISNYAQIVFVIIGSIVWLVRLESKLNFVYGKLNSLEADHIALKTKVYDQLTTIKESLAKIEGFLQAKRGVE